MKVISDGQDRGHLVITPDTTIGALKQYFNQNFPNQKIKLTFSNGQELSPVVWDTAQYDAVNFQIYAMVLNGSFVELKTDPKLEINQITNTMEKYTNFVQTGNQTAIDGWLDQLDTLYTKGTPAMSDDDYNRLVDIYKTRFGPRKVVGAPEEPGDVVLPIAMMSLDKAMKDKPKVLETWISNNPGPYEVMDKIDGNPGLYTITQTPKGPVTKMYKRGNGTKGPDISRILPYLNLPVFSGFDVHIKGELVVEKKDWERHKGDGPDQYKANLSMVSGLTNSKATNPNPEHLKLIKFIAFDISFPNNQNIELNMTQTLDQLTKYGFRTPFHIVTPALTIDWLSQLFERQREHQVYDVDGLVIVANRPVKYAERLIRDRNPRYAIAYKEKGREYRTTVTHIEWQDPSKHGVLTPVIHVKHTAVGNTGRTIRHPTGHNAKYIVDHQLGPGAEIVVIMNTIPKHVRTLRGVEPSMPPVDKYPPGSWEWNETGVEIVVVNKEVDAVKIARLYEFFRKEKINAKGWGEKTVARLYHAGFNTLKKLLETDKAGFMAVPIEGVGERGIDNLIKSRDLALPQASLATIMAGSSMFDHGIGKRMIQKVIDVYPNILDITPTLEQISAIEGFAEKKAQKFVAGLPKFKKFIADIPILQRAARGQLVPIGVTTQKPPKPGKAAAIAPVGAPTGETLVGKVVMFTGFRDAQLEAAIKAAGGSVKGSGGVTKKVNYVIVEGAKGKGSSKEKKAIQYGIPTPDIATFKGMFGIP